MNINDLYEAVEEKKYEILNDDYVVHIDSFGNSDYSERDEAEALEKAKEYYINIIKEI